MDFEEIKRRQNLKVIISESIMVLTVIVTVIILALLVSGYWINENFEVERQGMLQVTAHPSGVKVLIDDEDPWTPRLNNPKVLPAGEHTITLAKDGYDTWSKDVTISEGLLYRIHYPRLFPDIRESEVIYDAAGTTAAIVSSDRRKLLLYRGDLATLDTSIFSEPADNAPAPAVNLAEWTLINLDSNTPQPQSVDLRALYDFFREPTTV